MMGYKSVASKVWDTGAFLPPASHLSLLLPLISLPSLDSHKVSPCSRAVFSNDSRTAETILTKKYEESAALILIKFTSVDVFQELCYHSFLFMVCG